MSTDSKTIPQKLPFWHTVGEAYRLWAKLYPSSFASLGSGWL
jgi:hypothetical protein